MGSMEGLHGDWQHMTGEEVAGALEKGARALEAAEAAEIAEEESVAAEEAALATGGEAAVELEAAAAMVRTEVLEPLDEAGRDALCREIATDMDRPHVTVDELEPGPNGQYITGSPGA
ncbi:MAG TPA: hypothetical protein VFX84_01180 [Candidatus Saccharimonadales bacterium]|nr:hypothetical protein [Candidatus Saccharimonadales bacterium]